MPSWTYLGSATPERRAALEAPITFAEVVLALKQNMNVVCFHRDTKQRDNSYARAAFCADVGPTLFDAFFNAATGYRGAYFESPENGLAANRLLINALSPALTAWALSNCVNTNKEWLIESLSLPTAKAWLAEDTVALCANCAGGWSASYVSDLRIANGRWEQSGHAHAAWGRQAPGLTKIRVFGGFVNGDHQEWIADHKRERAHQIWEHGWT
jgi:hypothetical protein